MKRFFLILSQKKYLSHKNIVRQPFFLHKYSLQRVPNQVEKLRKFQGVGGQSKSPSVEGYGYFLELHNYCEIFLLFF